MSRFYETTNGEAVNEAAIVRVDGHLATLTDGSEVELEDHAGGLVVDTCPETIVANALPVVGVRVAADGTAIKFPVVGWKVSDGFCSAVVIGDARELDFLYHSAGQCFDLRGKPFASGFHKGVAAVMVKRDEAAKNEAQRKVTKPAEDALQALFNRKGMNAVRSALAHFGVKRLPELPVARHADLIAHCDSIK